MPPKIKITKINIIEAAFELLKEYGINKISAREISKKLNCSTQPIFLHFTSMDDLKTELINKSLDLYYSYIKDSLNKEKPYLATGLAYINLARNEKEIFKLLFMSEYNFKAFDMSNDKSLSDIHNTIQKQTNLQYDEVVKLHQSMWLYVHGIATMIATNYMNFTEQETKDLLTNHYKALFKYYRKD